MLLTIVAESNSVQIIKLVGLIIGFLLIIVLANLSPRKDIEDGEKSENSVASDDTDSK
ncbi:MAG TPA: hypothetical protein PLX95_01140 [bacterium]|nr:hypothetical protein [bacterium]